MTHWPLNGWLDEKLEMSFQSGPKLFDTSEDESILVSDCSQDCFETRLDKTWDLIWICSTLYPVST